MLKKNTRLLLVVIALALFSLVSNAVEVLSAEELYSHCAHYQKEPKGQDATFCVRYIQGFIDGAIATDARVTENVAREYEQPESLSQRAMRTRLGSRLKEYGPSFYAEFCLNDPLALKQIVEHVISDLQSRESIDERLTARGAVYQTLREKYPCTNVK